MDADTGEIKQLELVSAIGFDGSQRGALKVHPDRQHIVYPLGCTVVIEQIPSASTPGGKTESGQRRQQFLSGHSNAITCIAISKSGRYIASGQITHMGFKADIVVWQANNCGDDTTTCDGSSTYSEYARFTLHKVRVAALAFSPSERLLASLGGEDDGSVVIWSLIKREPICGSPAQPPSAGFTECLAFAAKDDRLIFTAGENSLRVWDVDVELRRLTPTDVAMGQLKRNVKCIAVQDDDQMFYCGTSSGDIIGVSIPSRHFTDIGPEKGKFSQGVLALAILKTGSAEGEQSNYQFLVGGGDGTVQLVNREVFSESKHKLSAKFVKTGKKKQLEGGVTSLALRGAGHQFFVGTGKSQLYRFTYADFAAELLYTCHNSAITDAVFPVMCDNGKFFGSSELFATCGFEDIRIWHVGSLKELLRISVPNMTCLSLEFSRDGRIVISGWNDSRVRAFYPESGRQMFEIVDAHKQGVTALAVTSDSGRLVTGGGEGQVRVWQIEQGVTPKGKTFVTRLIETMKEHKGSVNCIRVTKDDRRCVSASSDGTCIIWDLQRFVRSQVMFANTLFKCVVWHDPEECQLITSGTDRKVGYWEAFDGSLIRELLASRAGSVNAMHATSDGTQFATAGDDKLIKLWTYNEGMITHVGVGHSSAVQRLRICPNNKLLVSVSDDGAIFLWKMPPAAAAK